MRKLYVKTSFALALSIITFLVLPIYQPVYVPFQSSLYSVEEYIDADLSEYERLGEVLWIVRSYDVIVLSLLLFVATVCCASMLVPDESRRN